MHTAQHYTHYCTTLHALLVSATASVTVALYPAVVDEEDEAFTAGPKLARAISINLKSLISATDSPPRSPPSSTYPPASAPLSQATSSAVAQLIDLAPAPTLPSLGPSKVAPGAVGPSKVALVDYPDEDSDEDGDGDGVSSSKRSRIEPSAPTAASTTASTTAATAT